MPRNIIASKAAIGSLNTSNSKIIAVLTPQEELTAANTEIKRLRELLKAKDTPISSDNLLDRLTIILKALAYRLVLSHFIKVIDPQLLIDGTDPMFNNQKL